MSDEPYFFIQDKWLVLIRKETEIVLRKIYGCKNLIPRLGQRLQLFLDIINEDMREW